MEILRSRGGCCQSLISVWALGEFLAAGKRCHFTVQGWEAGSADDLSEDSNPAHPAGTRQAEKGSAAGLQGAGVMPRSNSWGCAPVLSTRMEIPEALLNQVSE